MSDDKEAQKKRDKVTVGQIRARQLDLLQKQINELSNILVNGGYHQLDKAVALIRENIADTLKRIDDINSMAGIVVIFPDDRIDKE